MEIEEEYFRDHRLVDFNKLSREDSTEIDRLKDELENHGWSFIQLPNENNQFIDKIDQIQKNLQLFFNRNSKEKSSYESKNTLGYSHINHKEGIRLLTNEHGHIKDQSFPDDEFQQTLESVAILCHSFTYILKRILLKMCTSTDNSNEESAPLSQWNMLDIVNYFNHRANSSAQPEIGLDTTEVNCVPHFDPGLFSLSIFSSNEGLQLKDRLKDKWIDAPNYREINHCSIAVLWLGEAASKLTHNTFKTGIHRIIYPQLEHQTRLTIWQEIPTKNQIETIFKQNDQSLVLPENTTVEMTNQPNSLPLKILPGGETMNDFLKRIESERGLAMSKSGVEHIQIKYPIRTTRNNNPQNKIKSFFSSLFRF